MRRLAILLLLVVAVLATAASHAQQPPPPSKAALAEARKLFRAGARAYDAGRFDVAVQAFDQAYELAPKVAIRFSTAQALRRLYAVDANQEHLVKALRYFETLCQMDMQQKAQFFKGLPTVLPQLPTVSFFDVIE